MTNLYGVDNDKNLYRVSLPDKVGNNLKMICKSQWILGQMIIQHKILVAKYHGKIKYSKNDDCNPMWQAIYKDLDKAKITKIGELKSNKLEDFRKLSCDKLSA